MTASQVGFIFDGLLVLIALAWVLHRRTKKKAKVPREYQFIVNFMQPSPGDIIEWLHRDEDGRHWEKGLYVGEEPDGKTIIQPLNQEFGEEIRTYQWDWPESRDD